MVWSCSLLPAVVQDECEGELSVAMPLLEKALAALNTLTKGDITEVKSMKNPPSIVKLVMESVCHMLGVKPKKVQDPTNPSKKVDDYWEGSQKLLGESGKQRLSLSRSSFMHCYFVMMIKCLEDMLACLIVSRLPRHNVRCNCSLSSV